MQDVVVTVPRDLWEDWLLEGDLPGDSWTGSYWTFYVRGPLPKRLAMTGVQVSFGEVLGWLIEDAGDELWLCAPGQRCYVVAHGRLRGFAPLFGLQRSAEDGRFAGFVRCGGAEPLTLLQPIQGFQGWRYRWWDRSLEVPFPRWHDPATQAPVEIAIDALDVKLGVAHRGARPLCAGTAFKTASRTVR